MEAIGIDWIFAEGLTVALGKDYFEKKLCSISLSRAVGGGPWQRLHPKKQRRHSYFSLSRAMLALREGFAECLIKGPRRQRPSLST